MALTAAACCSRPSRSYLPLPSIVTILFDALHGIAHFSADLTATVRYGITDTLLLLLRP
jgi:hypothetical protein